MAGLRNLWPLVHRAASVEVGSVPPFAAQRTNDRSAENRSFAAHASDVSDADKEDLNKIPGAEVRPR